MNWTIELEFDYSFSNNDNTLVLTPTEGEFPEILHRLY
jgi:hypothetical protein